jgi:hypothetical protein
VGQTPELDSLLLFGSSLTGLGGYALMRLGTSRGDGYLTTERYA